MNRAILVLATLALLFGGAGQAKAGLITVDFRTTLQLVGGGDAGGLDGATLAIHAEFDAAGVFINKFGIPALDALTHTITITGASVSGSNGIFSDPNGLTYYPTFANSFESNIGGFLAAGPLDLVLMETGPGSVIPSIGDTISVANFNTSVFDPRSIFMVGVDGSGYAWASNATLTVNAASAVPEPASLTLLGIGIAGLAASGRRRREPAVV